MKQYDYTGNKTKNYFTAYLQKCIRWKRNDYLKKRGSISDMEIPLEEELLTEHGATIEELAEMRFKEELLLKESNRKYPKWDELSDQRLAASLLLLREEERRFIYQHVFEEKSFAEMEALNGIPRERIQTVYFYAIRKIRNWMGGDR